MNICSNYRLDTKKRKGTISVQQHFILLNAGEKTIKTSISGYQQHHKLHPLN